MSPALPHAPARLTPRPWGAAPRAATRRAVTPAFAAAIALSLIGLAPTTPVIAAEIHTNGAGGGRWSDPSAWHANTPPTANDIVVISRGDTLAFDRDDSNAVSCRELLLDPGATLTFRPGSGRMCLSVAGPIENYGSIRIDTSKRPTDFAEIRLVSPDAARRAIRLLKGSALVVSGAEDLPGKRRNALLVSAPPPPAPGAPAAEPTAVLDASDGVMVDVRMAELAGVVVRLTSLDNTGAKANERANVVGNRFINLARLAVSACDTPRVADNLFLWEGKGQNPNPALAIVSSPLAQISGNVFKGNFERALSGAGQVDASLLNNTFEACNYGIVWEGPNAMIKGCIFRDCTYGMSLTAPGAAIEDTVFDAPGKVGVYAGGTSTLQIVNVQATNLPKEAVVVDLANSAQAQLLNCGFGPDRVRIPPKSNRRDAANKPEAWAEGQAYVVVHVKGQTPPGSLVELLTANPPAPLPPGAADLNIRNSPARIVRGWTPPPRSPDCIVVRTWRLGHDGVVEPVPTYTLRVLGPYPPDKPDAPNPVLKSLNVTPADNWYRPRPDEAVPTLEVPFP